MAEVFANSGESGDSATVPTPRLQGIFIPGIDSPNVQDGFGLITPLGGGLSARQYTQYGVSDITSLQETQLHDLAIAPAEGNIFNFEGLIGPQGIPGPPGAPGIIQVITAHNFSFLTAPNSNFLTTLPHNIDEINQLGTAADTMIYVSSYDATRNFVWTKTDIDSVVKSWNDSDINTDASFFIIAADAGIYVSTDVGDSWDKYNPDEDTYEQISCESSGGNAVVLGTDGKAAGTFLITSDYSVNWTEITIPAGVDLASGTTDGNTLPEPWIISGQEPEEREITFDSPVELTNGVTYAIVIRATGADINNPGVWMVKLSGAYPNGSRHASDDSGSSWTPLTSNDLWFQTKASGITKESYTFAFAGAGVPFWDTSWVAQTFLAESTYDISSVVLRLWRPEGASPGTITVSIRILDNVIIRSVKLGANGAFIVVAAKDGIYLSTDSGDNWSRKTPDDVEDTDWEKGICSSDGTYIIVVSNADAIYRSANSGSSWAEITPAGGDTFSINKMAPSDDGQFMVIVGQNSTDATESCYISTDYGATWTAKKPVAASIEYTECDISNDGTVIAVSTTSNFYISFDSGATWKEQGMASTAEVWKGLSISGDSTTGLVANTNNNDEFFIGINTELFSEATWAESIITSAGRALLDDATVADQNTTLGFGTGDSPTLTGLTLTGLTSTRLVQSGSALNSVADLTAWIAGTVNQIIVTDDTDGTVTLSAPQDIHTGASPTFVGLTATGTVQANAIIIADNGFIGSVSVPELIQLEGLPSGNVNFPNSSVVVAGNITSEIGTLFLGTNEEERVDDRIRFLSKESDFRIEWSTTEIRDDDTLRFWGEDVEQWNLKLDTCSESMNIIVDGDTSTLTLQDFDIIIEEDLEVDGVATIIGGLSSYSVDTSNQRIGVDVLAVITTGMNNLAFGTESLMSLTEGDFNIALGYKCLKLCTLGEKNVAIGSLALEVNLTGSFNMAIGFNALRFATGNSNVAIGTSTLEALTFTSNNVAIGGSAGLKSITSFDNVMIGSQAMQNVADGRFNTIIGHQAGLGVLITSVSPRYNTFIGYRSGMGITIGDENILVGKNAGLNITTGDNNIIIGADINLSVGTADNQLNIGGILYSADYTSTLQIGDGLASTNFTAFSATGGITQAGTADATLNLTTSSTQINWDNAFDNTVIDIAFNTGDGIITITQQDSGTLATDSLDGRYYTETELGSTDNALGASLIGVEDAMLLYAATDVEAALVEVMDMITIETHVADSFEVGGDQVGTITGIVENTQVINDGDELILNETTGGPNPNFVQTFEFSGITAGHEPNLIELHWYYSPVTTPHTISIQMYNYNTSTWDVIDNTTFVATGGTLTFSSITIIDGGGAIVDYTSGGAARVRFSHDDNGISSHDFAIDYLAIKDDHGIGSGITDHGGLSGLQDDDHNPLYHTDARAAIWLAANHETTFTHADIATNTSKVTNATHTGEVTGSGALTAQPIMITGKDAATVASGDLVLVSDINDSNILKKVTAQSIGDLGGGGGDKNADGGFANSTYTAPQSIDGGNA